MRWGHSWPHFRSIFFGNVITAPEGNVLGVCSMIILRYTKKMEVILFCAYHCCLAILGTRANAGHTPATLGHLPT